MKVLFAVSNENTSQAIIKKYQTEYKQIISGKNVYYFNAILKELQRDKTYDRIVISEDLEQYVNNDYDQMDKFLFDKLDSISDEASNLKGEDIPILLICSERRNKSEQILVKLFGIGIYNAIIGNDRSTTEVCKLINRPRSKKEAKNYYRIDASDVSYDQEDENDVSETEIQNILAHYRMLGKDEEKYVESFERIAEQYNEVQLKIICKILPLNVRAVLEESCPIYQELNSFTNKLNDDVRIANRKSREANKGTSEVLLKPSRPKISKPVVIPTSMNTASGVKVLKPVKKETIIESEDSDFEEDDEEEIENIETNNVETNDRDLGFEIEEEPEEELNEIPEVPPIEEPKKKRRGRPPKKKVEEPKEEEEEPKKKKRGRPRKKKVEEPEEVEENMVLPGFESQIEEDEDDEEETTDVMLPGFDSEDEDEEQDFGTVLPGFEDQDDEENDEDQEKYFNGGEDGEEEYIGGDEEPEYSPVMEPPRPEKVEQYEELDLSSIMNRSQKIVAFVGTGKNGTSFLVNNVAEILSEKGIDTAILDLSKNRNAYYIYTKNMEDLRNHASHMMQDLKMGLASGLIEHPNLTIYTSPYENDENLEAVEPIIESLISKHTVVLLDCCFDTPMRYFKYATDIYLVQSMDILTIQPLTTFVRKLTDKGMFEPSKAHVVLNKFMKTKEINENILIGGMSIYKDPAMTVRKELYDRRTVQKIVIPFDLKSYLKYLDGLVTCDISLKGYDRNFRLCLEDLAEMVYKTAKSGKQDKYMPPSVKNNTGFSPRMNDTLNQMKKNY